MEALEPGASPARFTFGELRRALKTHGWRGTVTEDASSVNHLAVLLLSDAGKTVDADALLAMESFTAAATDPRLEALRAKVAPLFQDLDFAIAQLAAFSRG